LREGTRRDSVRPPGITFGTTRSAPSRGVRGIFRAHVEIVRESNDPTRPLRPAVPREKAAQSAACEEAGAPERARRNRSMIERNAKPRGRPYDCRQPSGSEGPPTGLANLSAARRSRESSDR